MSTLQELQVPIDRAIVNAMIESTPESWAEIVLTLVRMPGEASIGNFVHELSNPEGHSPVGPIDDLFEATYKLDALLLGAGARLSKATYHARAEAKNWSFTANYEYL